MPSNAWHRAIVDILRNTAGNVTIISAAGLVPLIGMLGGAMEASRGYLVKTRLQQACDAAV
ncbi:TadE/TadG family type IV pilus assembly protein, partial [Sphingomonas carotinifaciens]|uniref:TadE/TadG family type IV pilus assembly protein n=1 Tax=Sphingomonas carotinifaciens TaxID=1166323 RepID=UPI0012373F99